MTSDLSIWIERFLKEAGKLTAVSRPMGRRVQENCLKQRAKN
jgi:hypothetical protein